MNSANQALIDAKYEEWQEDPNSVGDDWQRFFEGFELGVSLASEGDGTDEEGEQATASTSPDRAPISGAQTNGGGGVTSAGASPQQSGIPAFTAQRTHMPLPAAFLADADHETEDGLPETAWGAGDGKSPEYAHKQAGVYSLIVNYRMLGHFEAKLDPLGRDQEKHPLLDLRQFGLSDDDLDTEFDASTLHPPRRATLREIMEQLRQTYSTSVGFEYIHIQNTRERRWIQERIEPIMANPDYSPERLRALLIKLRKAVDFEEYLHKKYIGQKRFSLEGGESMIVALDALIQRAADAFECTDVIIGMPHRGRLNVLANIMEKSYKLIFSEFEDNYLPESSQGDGDVKYHKGYSSDHVTPAGSPVHLTLAANPSHLEVIDPIVEGRTRAKQMLISRRGSLVSDNNPTQASDIARGPRAANCTIGASRSCEPIYPSPASRRSVLPVLLHGDAAFTGQGVVWETLNLSKLEAYTTGGSIHIIVNNQVGFTTDPKDARSTYYCTDIAKGVEAPIFHVNADDVDAVAFVTELALDYRQQFGKDVVIDLICFRRYGHNENDEPKFTQPQMYALVEQHPGSAVKFTNRLMEEGHLTKEQLEDIEEEIQTQLAEDQEGAKKATRTQIFRMVEGQSGGGEWSSMKRAYSHERVNTGVDAARLGQIADKLLSIPEDFTPNEKLMRGMNKRLGAVKEGGDLDWASAELLAFGSLLTEGHAVRMTGQDCQRGTFSQRHSVLIDQKTGEDYVPLNTLTEDQALFEVYNSLLSEFAVLSFEYGVSLGDPTSLVIWEAQFGDFVNGAQVLIDQFLASGQSKWQRMSGLVMLLPHGYEGQGPEHSSARPERFLQLCAEDNMQVVNCTTPSQYFHLLRRQLKRDFRKPLVVMTPKSLLRLPAATSPVEDLEHDYFRDIMDDPARHTGRQPEQAKRVLLCSGKVAYDLLDAREKAGTEETIAIIRVEQLYPLNEDMLRDVVGRYINAEAFYWVQEEPQNMGAWSFLYPRLRRLFAREWGYIGRGEAASPSTGSLRAHRHEQAQLCHHAVENMELPLGGMEV